MKKLSMNDVPKFLSSVGAAMDLFVPVRMTGATNWGVWDKEREVDLQTLKSVKSPKDVFFPQCQTMYTVSKGEDGFSIDPMKLTDQPFCVFGIRPCDVRALTVMDQVFLADPIDTFYKARREQAILVSLACSWQIRLTPSTRQEGSRQSLYPLPVTVRRRHASAVCSALTPHSQTARMWRCG